MRLWASLYGMVWLVFVEIWLAYTPIAPPVPYYLHAAVGVGVVALAWINFDRLRATRVPARVKRIAKTTFGLALLMAFLGVLLVLRFGSGSALAPGLSVEGVVLFLHFVNAMAILAQTSAVAIAYDMWEDREFLRETLPGAVAAPGPPSALPP